MIHNFPHLSDKIILMGLSEFLRKTFADQKSRVRNAGQAVLEYILVLVITVSILLGIMYQFNDAFKQFIDSYFGDYIACLLETGELPSLGGTGPNQGQCSKPPFSIANGAKGPASSSGSGGGDGSSGSSENSSSDGSGDGDDESSGGSSRSLRPPEFNTSGGAANAEAATNRANSSGRPASQRTNLQSNNQQGGKGFGSDSTDSGEGGGSGRRIVRKRTIYLGDDFVEESAKRKKRSAVIGKAKSKKSNGGTSGLRQPKFALEVPKERMTASDDVGSGFSFGILIKILLIGGILIAIFIFLGGQAVQIKKSWQKSE